jgi:hypothetical protein
MSSTLALQVGNLVRERIDQLDGSIGVRAPGFWARTLSRLSPANSLNRWSSRKFVESARRYEQEAVWFEGATARLRSEQKARPNIVSQDALKALEALEDRLLSQREMCLGLLVDLRSRSAPGSQSIVESVSANVEALTDCYEAVSAFKWEAMEIEADFDIESGQVQSFGSTDDLIASLKS